MQLANGLGFDLSNSLTGYFEDVSDFFKRVTVAITKPVSELDDFSLAIAQRFEYILDSAAKHFLRRTDRWTLGFTVWQQITEVTVFAVSDRTIKTDRVPAHCQDSTSFVDRCFATTGNFFERWLAAKLLKQLTRDRSDSRHRLNHVDRNTNRSALVSNRTSDRLTNPPSRIRAEFESPTIFELVDRTHQTGVTFLDQIKEAQTTVTILLGDRNDQTEVTFGKLTLGLLVFRVNLTQESYSRPQTSR